MNASSYGHITVESENRALVVRVLLSYIVYEELRLFLACFAGEFSEKTMCVPLLNAILGIEHF
jgi:hypothetical protein